MDLYFSKNKKMKSDAVRREFRASPTILWHLLLGGFFVLFTFVIGYSYWVFYRVSHQDIFDGAPSGLSHSKGPIDVKKLNSVLDDFANRARNFENIKNHEPDVVDPSR